MDRDTADIFATSGRLVLLPDDAPNRELVAHVHPSNWRNPTPRGRYNLVVIGGGTAGLVAAIGAAGLGAKVALIERHLLGGDCLNTGCVPSKALLRAARAAYDAREFASFAGGVPQSVSVDFAQVMRRMRQIRAGIAHHDSAQRCAESGVDVFFGEAKFGSKTSVEVAGEQLHFARAVIATGTRPAPLWIPGLAEAGFLTNETIFSLTELPRRLAVVGAGPVGCELAQAFRRLGSEVTLLSRGPRLLPQEDEDATTVLRGQFLSEGISLLFGAKVTSVIRSSEGKTVVFDRVGVPEELTVDAILIAVGRVPNVEGLGLEAARVAFDYSGVKVDDRLRTTNSRVFAAGDICSPYKFTHAADAMARIVIQNALFFGRKTTNSLVIPWTTYTDPEIAHVGLNERQAQERGHPVRTSTVQLSEVDRPVLDGETNGFARFHIDDRSGRILGAPLVARHAGEMIGEMSLAITHRLTAGSLSKTIHPYPTRAEAWKRLGDSYAFSRLDPWRRLFKRYLAWRR